MRGRRDREARRAENPILSRDPSLLLDQPDPGKHNECSIIRPPYLSPVRSAYPVVLQVMRARGHHHPRLDPRRPLGPIVVEELHDPGWLFEPEWVGPLDPEFVAPALESPPVAAVLEDDVIERSQHGGWRRHLGHGPMVGIVPSVVLSRMARLARDRGRKPSPGRLLGKVLLQFLVYVRAPKNRRADRDHRTDDEDDPIRAIHGARLQTLGHGQDRKNGASFMLLGSAPSASGIHRPVR